jgi:hypothetical protein
MVADIWEDMAPAIFKAEGMSAIYIAIRVSGEAGKNRLVARRRPWQKGVKWDSTGEDEDRFKLDIIFNNDISEAALPGPPMWPDRKELFIKALKVQKTATLNLPWKAGLRVRADNWSSSANAEGERGGETVSVEFVTDTEDVIDREAVRIASARSMVNGLVEQAIFDAESLGLFDFSMADLQELASALEALITLPTEMYNEIFQAATAVRRAVKTVLGAVEQQAENNPLGGSMRAKLLEIAELAAGSLDQAREHMPRTKSVLFKTDRNLSDIAAEVKQPFRDLLSINEHLEDPSFIPAKTPVKIFDGPTP